MIDADTANHEHGVMRIRTCRSMSSCSTAAASVGLQMLEPSSGRSALFSAPAATSTKLKAGRMPAAVVQGCSQRHQSKSVRGEGSGDDLSVQNLHGRQSALCATVMKGQHGRRMQ